MSGRYREDLAESLELVAQCRETIENCEYAGKLDDENVTDWLRSAQERIENALGSDRDQAIRRDQ